MPSYQLVIPLVLALVNAVLVIFVLLGKRDLPSRIYAIFVTFVALWCLAIAYILLWEGEPRSIIAINFNYVAALGHIYFFLLFTKMFPTPRWSFGNAMCAAVPPLVMSAFIALSPSFLVFRMNALSDVVIHYEYYLFYALLVGVYILWAVFSLLSSYRKSTEQLQRQQLGMIFSGTATAYVVGFTPTIIIPWFGDYRYIWLGPVVTMFMISAIGYAITRHRLFNVKVIATEFFTFLLWLFLLIKLLTSTNQADVLLNIVVFVSTTIFGILLIRSVLQEVRNREKIEILAKDLEAANARLKELDQQKSEFVSIASHQLRSPLTAIKGYVSMLLEDTPSYGVVHEGKITAAGVEALSRVFKSSNALVDIIEDLLNISRIEQGRMQYTMTDFDVGAMTHELVENLAVNARERGLTITYHAPITDPFIISGDIGKVRQVINNVIDNSIKYTPKGSIAVTLDRTQEGKTQIQVKDTGIGIAPEVLPKLFQKFSRAHNAGKVNVTGTGIGLFIAEEIMRAHQGRVWAESPGEGKGSTFFIEFPPKQK